jgi:hypothetical protein
MSISIKLVDSIKTVEKNVNAAIANAINDKIRNNLSKIKSSAKKLVRDWVSTQPEIESLKSSSLDSLVGYFGLTRSPQDVVEAIVYAASESTEVKFVEYSSKFSGGLELRFQPSSFSNLLMLPEGHTVYSGGNLHWLDWLLKRGDRIIIANYQYNPMSGLGRSGLGIMIPGGAFRIPPQFSGTEDNNFITRALIGKTQENQIAQLIQRVLA